MTQTNVNVQMQIRRDTAANWNSTNPVLLAGEWAYVTDTGKFKIGNGSTGFNQLPEAVLSTFGGTLTDHLKISNQKELRLSDDTANTANEHYSSLKAGSQSANINYTLPTTAPTDNQYLKCSAAGVLSWDTFTGTDLADLLSNDGNNRVLTATGTTNSFNAETNLTFNGSTLAVLGSSQVIQSLTTTNSNGAYIEFNLGASGAGIGYIGSGIQLVTGGSAANFAIRAENLLQLCISNSPKLNINSSGFIGIGTTSPNRLIHGAGATPILKLDSTNNEAYIQLVTASPANESYIGLVSGDIYMSITGTGATGNEKFRIKANGRVGINQASPAATLQVNDPNGDNVTLVLATTASNNFIQIADSANSHAYIGKENSQTSFYTANAAGSATEKIAYFNSNGLNLVAGKGVNFSPYDNTVSNPGSYSNSLSDYEEGTYDVVDNSGAGLTLTNNTTAHYTKIGKVIHVQFDVTWPSTTSSAMGAISLPFSGVIAYGSGTVGWTDIGKPLQIHVSTTAAIMDNDGSNKHTLNNELSGKRAIGAFTFMVA